MTIGAMSKKGAWTDKGAADSPFAGLAALRDALPETAAGPASEGAARSAPGAPAKAAPKGPAKAVVRLERKGRGGKDVTIISQLALSPAELETWLKALKGQLGCGGAIEGDELVLQGDLRKRVGPMLEARGVRKVVVG